MFKRYIAISCGFWGMGDTAEMAVAEWRERAPDPHDIPTLHLFVSPRTPFRITLAQRDAPDAYVDLHGRIQWQLCDHYDLPDNVVPFLDIMERIDGGDQNDAATVLWQFRDMDGKTGVSAGGSLTNTDLCVNGVQLTGEYQQRIALAVEFYLAVLQLDGPPVTSDNK